MIDCSAAVYKRRDCSTFFPSSSNRWVEDLFFSVPVEVSPANYEIGTGDIFLLRGDEQLFAAIQQFGASYLKKRLAVLSRRVFDRNLSRGIYVGNHIRQKTDCGAELLCN
ncbi:MAG: hypothetical protein OXG77_06295 [Chloroflexi bacterium]|nr:hypothetical protein [Chloroflexota bacterium]